MDLLLQVSEEELEEFPEPPVDHTDQDNVVLFCWLVHKMLQIPLEFYHLRGLRKDTNCWSELKPVFIDTGIHMFISYGNIFKRVLEQRKPVLLCTAKLYNMIHWSSQQ